MLAAREVTTFEVLLDPRGFDSPSVEISEHRRYFNPYFKVSTSESMSVTETQYTFKKSIGLDVSALVSKFLFQIEMSEQNRASIQKITYT